MKDIYADDITLDVTPSNKLVTFLESGVASGVLNKPTAPLSVWPQLAGRIDHSITAVNAAFALALCERHDLVDTDHRLYDLAHAAANDAPNVDVGAFKSRFRTLTTDPDEAEYRNALVDVTRAYTASTNG